MGPLYVGRNCLYWRRMGPRLIGRQKELHALQNWISQRGRARGPLAFLVSGQAGIGKTSLAVAATRDNSGVWISFPPPREDAPAFGLWELARNAEKRHPNLLRILKDQSTLGDPETRQRISEAAARLVEEGEQRLLILDDCQWADAPTLAWLREVAQRLREFELGVLLITRSQQGPPQPIATTLAYLRRIHSLGTLVLGPLSRQDTMKLARSLGVSQAAASRFRLFERTGGVPIAVEHLCGSLAEIPTPHSVIHGSASLPELIQEQLSQLPRESRALIEYVAIAPQPLAEASLQLLLGFPRASFLLHLDKALATGLIISSAKHGVRFVHDMHRQVVEEALSLGLRRTRHLRIAEALAKEQHPAPGRIAHQYLEAGAEGQAREWLLRAGEEALNGHDGGAAVEYFSNALSIGVQNGQLDLDTLDALVRAARLGSQSSKADEVLRDTHPKLERPLDRARIVLARARLAGYLDRYGDRLRFLKDAERLFRRFDSRSELASTLSELAAPHGTDIPLEERVRYGDEAVRIVESEGSTLTHSKTLANTATARFLSGQMEALTVMSKARQLLPKDDRDSAVEAGRQLFNQGVSYFVCGRYLEAHRAASDLAMGVGVPHQEHDSTWLRGVLSWREGKFDEAEKALAPAAGLMASLDSAGLIVRTDVEFERGNPIHHSRLEAAVRHLVLNHEVWAGTALAVVMKIRFLRNDPHPTRYLDPLLRQLEITRTRVGWQDVLPVLAAFDPAKYDHVLVRLQDLPPAGDHDIAAFSLAQGIRQRARDLDSAEKISRDAAMRLRALGERVGYAHALRWLSTILIEKGNRASAELREAADIYESAGAHRSLASLLRQFRGNRSLEGFKIPAAHQKRVFPGLTPRQAEVARLASVGYTASEIAEELHIATATARRHIEQIKQKLGLGRKRELVRSVHQWEHL